MPELPEVETIKEALKKSIENATIETVSVRNRQFREVVPSNFEQSITNTTIKKIYRLAKYLVLELDNGKSIIWHLGMSGKIKILDSLPVELDKHDHIIISTNKGVIIYNDIRRFGLVTFTKTDELNNHHLFSKMGIDPFDENLSPEYLYNKFKNKKIAIKIALLDQSIINGIGNIYASEALYDASISPLKECCDLDKIKLSRLIISVRKTLTKAIKAGGSTLKDYRKPDGSMGYFQNQHCVYDKEGKQCPNCTCDIVKTGGIKRIVQGGRSTFYCSKNQK